MAHKRPPKPVIAIVILLALALVGWLIWMAVRPTTEEAGLTGTVEADEYQVASVIAGRVAAVAVDEGATVAKGDPLVTLDAKALKLQVDQANEGVRAAKAGVTQAKDDGTKAEVTAAKARLKQAEAAVALAKVQLGYATIKAPADGRVVTVTTNVGQNAAPGRTLVTLADPTDLFVRVYVAEPDLAGVQVGESATVVTDSGQSFTGAVATVATEAEFTPNNVETKEQRTKLVYEVRVSVSDDSGALKAGMPVEVTLA